MNCLRKIWKVHSRLIQTTMPKSKVRTNLSQKTMLTSSLTIIKTKQKRQRKLRLKRPEAEAKSQEEA